MRYYEQVGLIKSVRLENEKYRFFDNKTITRLKEIIILRKMQIPIKDIIHIYDSQNMSSIVNVFVNKINEIDDDIHNLSELRRIVNEFLKSMQNNGIKKISALPLIYEELEKQLEKNNNKKEKLSYVELSEISEKVKAPYDVRIMELPAMRMLSSYIKGTSKTESSSDEFWEWLNKTEVPLGRLGSHTFFDFQIRNKSDNYETVMMLKIPEKFTNDSKFEDYVFEGGLFAVASTFIYDGIGDCQKHIIDIMDVNKFYKIDYTHDGKLRHESLVESVISPDETNSRVDVFVPIKKRAENASLFNIMQLTNNITANEIIKENHVIKEIDIKLNELTPILNPSFSINEDNEVELISYIGKRVLSTNEKIEIPFKVDIIFKATNASVRLYHNKAAIIFNSNVTDGYGYTKDELVIHDPIFGSECKFSNKGGINKKEYNHLSWIVGEKYFAVILNGEVRHCGVDYPYMQTNLDRQDAFPVSVGSNSKDILIIRSINISQIKKKKKLYIKKGELTMINKQSNNILSNIHKLVTWHFGQNYTFNGCMAYLMECLGEDKDQLDYWFFSGITGDNLTQVYCKDHEKYVHCVSVALSGETIFKGVFDIIGYEYTYVAADELNANKSMYIETVKVYIDKGLPVIQDDKSIYTCNYKVICGYEEDGKTLLYLEGDNPEPQKYDATEKINEDWIFIGSKIGDLSIEDIYRNTIMNIPKFIRKEETNNCVFGSQAFNSWADDIENGRFDYITDEQFDAWGNHSVYVCNYSTNMACTNFLERAVEINPEMTFINEIIDIYKNKQEKILKEMQAVEGDFNVTLAVLKDKDKRKKIADTIRKFAKSYDEIYEIVSKTITN